MAILAALVFRPCWTSRTFLTCWRKKSDKNSCVKKSGNILEDLEGRNDSSVFEREGASGANEASSGVHFFLVDQSHV